MSIPTVTLRPGRERALAVGRRWVYRSELGTVAAAAQPGDVVDVLSAQGAFVARGFYNPRSQLAVRVVTEDRDEAVDADLVRRRVAAAWQYRRRLADDPRCCRVIFAEADGLPGVIADRLGDVVVLQVLALGMARFQEVVVAALAELLLPRAIYARNDGRVRVREGLPEERGTVWGSLPERVEVEEGGIRLAVDPAGGQKTGHYLDQRANHLRLRQLARAVGGEALDAFCHTGGFGLQALAAGCRRVTFLDSSAAAVAAALDNAAANGFAGRAEGVTANAFDQLRAFEREGRRFDVIVLDPPAFARGRSTLDAAYRGYKDINLRAMRLLRPGGLLVTCSCSQPVSEDMFLRMLTDAAADAGCRMRLIERRGPGTDHPGLLGADETVYLKCAFLQRLT
jgi:23S rRNA (cytosine1962-C5)-methyltransferase